MKFLGSYYGRKSEIPVTAGMKVRIPKGATLRSMHPSKNGPYPATRTQIVTVHHLLYGCSVTLGHKWPGRDEVQWSGHREKDLLGYCRKLGIEYDYRQASINAAIAELYSRCVERQSDWPMVGPNKGQGIDMVLHLDNPAVRWPGSGGYWVECDVNEVEIIEEAARPTPEANPA